MDREAWYIMGAASAIVLMFAVAGLAGMLNGVMIENDPGTIRPESAPTPEPTVSEPAPPAPAPVSESGPSKAGPAPAPAPEPEAPAHVPAPAPEPAPVPDAGNDSAPPPGGTGGNETDGD